MIFISLCGMFCRIRSASGGPVMTSSSPVTSNTGTLMVFRSGTESGRSAMPRCTWATYAGKIRRMLLHGGRAFACAGVAVTAEVRKDHLIAGNQRLGCRDPQFMISRERVQKDDRRARRSELVRDIGIAALDVNHLGDSKTKKILNRKERERPPLGSQRKSISWCVAW